MGIFKPKKSFEERLAEQAQKDQALYNSVASAVSVVNTQTAAAAIPPKAVAVAKAPATEDANRSIDNIRKNVGGFFGSALGGYSSGSYLGQPGSARGRLLG